MSVDLDSWSILRKLTVYVASKKNQKGKKGDLIWNQKGKSSLTSHAEVPSI